MKSFLCTYSQTESHTETQRHTQYKKITSLKRVSNETEKFETGIGESQSGNTHTNTHTYRFYKNIKAENPRKLR